jgi:hypothetical protein
MRELTWQSNWIMDSPTGITPDHAAHGALSAAAGVRISAYQSVYQDAPGRVHPWRPPRGSRARRANSTRRCTWQPSPGPSGQCLRAVLPVSGLSSKLRRGQRCLQCYPGYRLQIQAVRGDVLDDPTRFNNDRPLIRQTDMGEEPAVMT